MLPLTDRRRFLTSLAACALSVHTPALRADDTPSTNAANPEEPVAPPSILRTGDVVFQHVPTHLSSYVAELTGSPVSNCGLVARMGRDVWVLDTLAGVRYVPWDEWVAQGRRGEFFVARYEKAGERDLAAVVSAAAGWIGRGHDLALAFDDQRLCGGELVYKAFLRGARIQVCSRQPLIHLAWKPCEAYLRALSKGDLLLDRDVLTPAGLMAGGKLRKVLSTLVVEPETDLYRNEPPHRLFRGTWSGQYTLDDNAVAAAWIEFGLEGEFAGGAIIAPSGQSHPIRRMGIVPLDASGEFVSELLDGRGFTTEIRGQLRDNGTRLMGAWKDERGRRGLCSLAKTEPVA
jgi:hypothetical protein